MSGAPSVLLTHSCTKAYEMAAISCDLSPSGEAIMPFYVFVLKAKAVVLRGAVPVFLNIDPMTPNIDLLAAEATVEPNTRTTLVVYYVGSQRIWIDWRPSWKCMIYGLWKMVHNRLYRYTRAARVAALGIWSASVFMRRRMHFLARADR